MDNPRSSPIQRVAMRLRNISQLSTQIARTELADNVTANLWPMQLRTLAAAMIDAGQTLMRYADEQEVYLGHRHEDADALAALAVTAANISTILGTDGGNLEILTHSDPDYVLGVLTRATEEAKNEAVNKLPAEEKAKWLKWLGGNRGDEGLRDALRTLSPEEEDRLMAFIGQMRADKTKEKI